MKMLTALIAVFSVSAAFASSGATKPNRVFKCGGAVSRLGGLVPSGAPRVRVLEYLEKVGPMLPAFRSVYVLEVSPINPMVPFQLYSLEFVSSPMADIHVYAALNEQGEKSTFTVEHNIFKNIFLVKVGHGALTYTCSAPRF